MSVPTLKLEVEELGGPPAPAPRAVQTDRPASAPRPSSRPGSASMAGFEMLMKGSSAKEPVPDRAINELAASLDQFVEEVKSETAPAPMRIQPMDAQDPRGPQPVQIGAAVPAQTKPIRLEAQAMPGAPTAAGDAGGGGGVGFGGAAATVGQHAATSVRTEQNDRSWDGFKPFAWGSGAAAPGPAAAPKAPMTESEIMAAKFKYIRYLEALDKKPGITVSKKYDMKSSLEEMEAEYNLIKGECEKKQSMAFQGKMLMAAVSGLEYLNSKFDPFDVDLNGWGESVGENMEEYDDVFAELHEKYKGRASIAPEIKLMFMLAGSASMVHMTNTMFKPQLPGMDDLVQHNPELANRIAGAAADGLVARGQPAGGSVRTGQLPPAIHTARPHGGRAMPPPGTVQAPPRAEMKGPDNFEEIMSRIKRKNADAAAGTTVTEPPTTTPTASQGPTMGHGTGAGVRLAPPEPRQQAAPTGPPRTVSIRPTVLEGLQKAERTPVRAAVGRKRKAPLASDSVLKLEI